MEGIGDDEIRRWTRTKEKITTAGSTNPADFHSRQEKTWRRPITDPPTDWNSKMASACHGVLSVHNNIPPKFSVSSLFSRHFDLAVRDGE